MAPQAQLNAQHAALSALTRGGDGVAGPDATSVEITLRAQAWRARERARKAAAAHVAAIPVRRARAQARRTSLSRSHRPGGNPLGL